MTPEQVAQKLESDLVTLSEKYIRYKMRLVRVNNDSERILCRNTMSHVAVQIKDVLFKMYLKDLEEKCQHTQN